MVGDTVVPDLVRRSGQQATIRSRFLRVWGMTESKVAEVVAPRVEALEAPGSDTTIAFLASATEGIRVRITARAHGKDAEAAAVQLLDKEEAELGRFWAKPSGEWTTRVSRWWWGGCWPRPGCAWPWLSR